MDFEPSAVVGDAQAVGDVLVEGAFGGCFGVGQLAPPLDGNHLPPGRRSLPDHVGAERPGNHIAYPLEIRHRKPPWMVLQRIYKQFDCQTSGGSEGSQAAHWQEDSEMSRTCGQVDPCPLSQRIVRLRTAEPVELRCLLRMACDREDGDDGNTFLPSDFIGAVAPKDSVGAWSPTHFGRRGDREMDEAPSFFQVLRVSPGAHMGLR